MPLALVVDGDAQSRTLHASVLRRIPGISAVGVASIQEALMAASIEAPSVILAALSLPDGPVTELIDKLWALREPSCVLVLVSDLSEGPELPSDPRVHRVRKPAEPRSVRRLVQRSIRATLERVPLIRPAEYIQLLCIGDHSATLQCFVDGRPLGEIRVVKGQLWSAMDDTGEGADALKRILQTDNAVAQTVPLGTEGPRNIEDRWELLLLEAAQEQDESGRASETDAGIVLPAPVEKIADLLHAARTAVVRGELAAGAKLFQEALKLAPNDRLLLHNIKRLRELGYDGSSD